MARGRQHPAGLLRHLAGGGRVVQLPALRLGRVRARALRPLLHHRLAGLPHLCQGRLLRHLLVRLLHTGASVAHRGVAVPDPLQGVTLLLLAVGPGHPQQPAARREAALHGEAQRFQHTCSF